MADPRILRDPQSLSVKFWGVRGSIPAPGPDTLRYGGETTCLEVWLGDRLVIIDCGSGVRLAGRELQHANLSHVDCLFTHTHLDHICGLPFFCLAYDPLVEVNLWAGHVPPGGTLEEIVERLMSPPIFPVATSALNNTRFCSFRGGNTIDLGDGLTVRTVRLNHPGNATGYRFDHHGSSLAIITDHEHGNPEIDAAVATFVEGASVMVYDAMYLDNEYSRFVGWGHSTPSEALKLAAKAGVKHTVLFHHDPWRTDDQIDALAANLKGYGDSVSMARQGDTLTMHAGSLLAEDALRVTWPA
ncbi:MAG: MBL fold metallo-hydrolase [Acuticoccus sp.]